MPSNTAQEIAALKDKLLLMAGYAEISVNRAVKALVRRDDELARQTGDEDDCIDSLEVEVDEMSLRLLERRPDAVALRFVAMAMKIANNLERVGDEATTISRRVIALSHEPQLAQTAEVPRMAGLALAMLKDALDSFVQADPARARRVIPRDSDVDALNGRLQGDLARLMDARPAAVQRALDLMVICKSLERIADHATNVAEQVVYVYEGCDIRHAHEVPPTDAPDSRIV